jgi:hypothetical protein
MTRSSITNPKRDMRRIYCDVCGFEYTVKDVRKVTDKYNRRYGLILCKRCFAVNKTNPQDRPFAVKEVMLTNTQMVRPEPPDVFSINENDDRLPGKPTDGVATLDVLNNRVMLFWQPPQDQGSSLITGYVVKRASPALAYYFTIEDNTETSVCTFFDNNAELDQEYTYTVSAINGFGTGPESNPIWWPKQTDLPEDIEYLVDENNNTIIDEDGNAIRTNYPGYGIL